jgi:hypothetical protein
MCEGHGMGPKGMSPKYTETKTNKSVKGTMRNETKLVKVLLRPANTRIRDTIHKSVDVFKRRCVEVTQMFRRGIYEVVNGPRRKVCPRAMQKCAESGLIARLGAVGSARSRSPNVRRVCGYDLSRYRVVRTRFGGGTRRADEGVA